MRLSRAENELSLMPPNWEEEPLGGMFNGSGTELIGGVKRHPELPPLRHQELPPSRLHGLGLKVGSADRRPLAGIQIDNLILHITRSVQSQTPSPLDRLRFEIVPPG